jgi:hypothetical protein
MGRLDPATASKLAKICGMFASDQLGERASAALKAADLVKRAGCTWDEVLAPAPAAVMPGEASGPTASAVGMHRSLASWALRYPENISAWELTFLRSMSVRRKPPTQKQSTILCGIVDKLRKAGAV